MMTSKSMSENSAMYRLTGSRRVTRPLTFLQAHMYRKSGEIIEKLVNGWWFPLSEATQQVVERQRWERYETLGWGTENSFLSMA